VTLFIAAIIGNRGEIKAVIKAVFTAYFDFSANHLICCSSRKTGKRCALHERDGKRFRI